MFPRSLARSDVELGGRSFFGTGLLVLLQQRLEARVVAGDYFALCNYGLKMSPPAPVLVVGVS